ncbi:MAG TPA: glycosyltransferase family 39 protein [Pyrinomonadaceae bacterium]
MSASTTDVRTARITPELFPEQITRASSVLLVASLSVLVLFGFGLRAYRLDAEGLSEDELNKVRAVADYRQRGLTPTNGEHPFLMKALLTVSIVAAESWNRTAVAESRPHLRVSTETAARLPGAFLGALSSVLIFLLASELFGAGAGLLAAALWAFDPAAIGFNRIAKEDSFLVFFFILANYFWLRGQRAAERGDRNPEPFYWAAAAAFGATMASKYVPHFFAITISYYYIFQGAPRTRWRLGKLRWLKFFAIMGAAFVICNPTILLPGTWHEMRVFATENRIGHDAYEFMGQLYRNQATLWLQGSPWYFYFVFMGVKMPTAVVAGFVVGLPLLFRQRLGDGRYFVLFWLFFWFFPFTLLGGKFTRYFTFVLPAVHITAALGILYAGRLLARLLPHRGNSEDIRTYARAALAVVVVAFSAYASVSAAPFYRLYMTALGGGARAAGAYFPHDEFYDAALRDAAREVALLARPGAIVASETPELLNYYARLHGRDDLTSVSLSDREARDTLRAGDLAVVARGRRYFSNDALISDLNVAEPAAVVSHGGVEAARIYVFDDALRARTSDLLAH